MVTPIATKPAVRTVRAAAKPAAVKPAAAPRASAKPKVQSRVIVARNEAPPESLWYRFKKAAATILCNLTVPRMEIRRVEDTAPEGLAAKLKPGDVLLRRTEGTSGNFFIPSWWKHAAVYVGDGKVVEATFAGVKESTLDEFFEHGDHVAIMRGPKMTDAQRETAARYAKLQVGKPYDFDVDFDDDSRQTCTELAYHAVQAATGKSIIKKNWMGVVVGDDFVESAMKLVYSSTPEHTQKPQ